MQARSMNGQTMARRANYGFEKRQKEIKKEQKRAAKLEKKHAQKDSQEEQNEETAAEVNEVEE